MEERIIKSLQGKLDPAETRELERWRQASADNEELYQSFTRVWQASRRPRHPAAAALPMPSVRDIVRRAEPRSAPRAAHPSRTLHPWLAAAAVVAIALGLGYVAGRGPELAPRSPAGHVATGTGKVATTHLVDGTVVRLGPESRLEFPGGEESRHVRLHGTAFFAVASDSTAPFTVTTDAGEVRVLGTRFELSSRDEELRLLVVEGLVELQSAGGRVAVSRDEVAHASRGTQPTVAPAEDVWSLLDWMGAFLAFESTPLREVRIELRERFGVELSFDDPSLAEETVTVWFGDEGIDDVATVLCRLLEVECTVDDAAIRMARPE